MCVTSVIHDYGAKLPLDSWTPPTFDYFKLLIEQAKYFDSIAKQPHCEDPEKVASLASIEEYLKSLETKIDTLKDQVAKLEVKVNPDYGVIKQLLISSDVATETQDDLH